MPRSSFWPLAMLLLLSACTRSDSPAPIPAPGAAAPAATSAQAVVSGSVRGVVFDAPAGTEVFLVSPDPTALTLNDQAGTIVDVADVDDQGGFAFDARRDPSPLQVVVSAPGHALETVTVGDAPLEVRLSPEGRVDVQLSIASGTAEDTVVLVRDQRGSVLLLPPLDLASDRAGRLIVRRLPAGTYELLFSAADGQHFARRTVTIGAEQVQRIEVELRDDPSLQLGFLKAVGGPNLDAFLEELGQ